MRAGVKDLGCVHRPAETIENRQISIDLAIRRQPRRELIDSERAGRRRDASLADDAIPHGRRRVPVDIPEVPVAVDERVAHREVLRQADERVVDRGIAVGVVLAHHLAHDLRALDVLTAGLEPELVHHVQDSAVNGL